MEEIKFIVLKGGKEIDVENTKSSLVVREKYNYRPDSSGEADMDVDTVEYIPYLVFEKKDTIIEILESEVAAVVKVKKEKAIF